MILNLLSLVISVAVSVSIAFWVLEYQMRKAASYEAWQKANTVFAGARFLDISSIMRQFNQRKNDFTRLNQINDSIQDFEMLWLLIVEADGLATGIMRGFYDETEVRTKWGNALINTARISKPFIEWYRSNTTDGLGFRYLLYYEKKWAKKVSSEKIAQVAF